MWAKARYALVTIVIMLMISSLMSTATEAISPEDFEYEVKDDGMVEITGYNGEEVDLIIPEEIDGKLVTSIAEYAF